MSLLSRIQQELAEPDPPHRPSYIRYFDEATLTGVSPLTVSEIVPPGKEWWIVSAYVEMSTSAVVADRGFSIQLTTPVEVGAVPWYRVYGENVSKASMNRIYDAGAGLPMSAECTYGTITYQTLPLPEAWLDSTVRIALQLLNAQAGDAIKVRLMVRERDVRV